MYLVFDTETSGLPQNWKAPVTAVNNWPRLIQIAWVEFTKAGEQIDRKSYIIRPEGFKISKAAIDVHGITTEQASTAGTDLVPVLLEFSNAIDRSKNLVAHNISFDEKVVGAEFLRNKISNRLFQTQRICTMKMSTNYCKIPGSYGYKWPSLSELHYKLFGSHFQEAHNADIDVEVCAKCFFELKRIGIIT